MIKDELYTGFWVDFYDKLFPARIYPKTFKIIHKLIKKHNSNAKNVLEVACGTGRYVEQFVKAGFIVKGVDISQMY